MDGLEISYSFAWGSSLFVCWFRGIGLRVTFSGLGQLNPQASNDHETQPGVPTKGHTHTCIHIALHNTTSHNIAQLNTYIYIYI